MCKTFVILQISLFLLFGTACNGYVTPSEKTYSIVTSTPYSDVINLSASPTSVSKQIFSPTEIILPSATPISISPISIIPSPTSEPVVTPTKIPTPSPIPFPTLALTNEVNKSIALGNYKGYWSPAANELLLNDCGRATETKTKSIFRAEPPNFELVDITPDVFFCSSGNFQVVWTPDGKQIAFNGLSYEIGDEPSEYASYFPDSGEVWVMSREGINPHYINPNFGNAPNRYFDFIGWMNDKTMVYSGYTGGGSRQVTILDMSTNKYVVWDEVLGIMHPPNSEYVPVSTHSPPLTIIALPKIGLTTEQSNYRNAFNIEDDFRLNYQTTLTGATTFEDWLRDTNTMLVRESRFEDGDSNLPSFQLLLWDIESNNLTSLVSSGMMGRFAPDGLKLVYVKLELVNEHEPVPMEQYRDLPRSLHLFDMATEQTIFSSSVVADDGFDWPFSNQDFNITFSPDSRYLTFFSTDPELNPQSKDEESGNIYLTIFNIVANEIVFTALSAGGSVVWSPNSDRVSYFDENYGLKILNVSDFNSTKLIESGGQRIQNIQWSFDGTYISFNDPSQMVILDIPN